MIRHYVLTLNGSAQALSSVSADAPVFVRTVAVQPGGANANPVYAGGPGTSSTSYGVRMEASSGGVPPAPFVFGEGWPGACRLDEIHVVGTAAEKLHILVDA